MTWTSAFGRGSGFLLDAIVRWLALARINPNVLTFLGLVVNTIAAFLFGYGVSARVSYAAVDATNGCGDSPSRLRIKEQVWLKKRHKELAH